MGETVDGWNPALHQLIGWLVVYAMVFLRGLFPSQVVQDLLISSINRITGNHRHLVSWVEDLLQSNLACEERISLRRDVVGPKILRLQHVDKNPELGIRNMWIDDTSYFSVRYWLIIYKSEKVNGTWLHLHPSNPATARLDLLQYRLPRRCLHRVHLQALVSTRNLQIQEKTSQLRHTFDCPSILSAATWENNFQRWNSFREFHLWG